jgi:HlyD family secretion protein
MVAEANTPGLSPQSAQSDVSAIGSQWSRPETSRLWPRRLAVGLIITALLTASGWAAVRFSGFRGPVRNADMKTAVAHRGELLVLLKAEGNLESAVNIDLKCEITGGSAILSIVEDGDQVKKGDKLVELDTSTIEEQINTQRITYEKARATTIQAEKDLAAAKIAVDEYLQGSFVQASLDAENKITIASENLRSAQNTLEHSQRMFRKGYISSLDLTSQTFSVQRAQLELDSANTAKNVLLNYTKEKMLQELASKRDSAEALMQSEKATLALEESRLKRLEAQIEKCVLYAPADGMVVYANEQDHRGQSQQAQIEEGAAVRERQTILRLPDLEKMQVKVNVHESSVEPLAAALRAAERAGTPLPAELEVQNLKLQGRLVSIANQPAPIDFRTGNIKQYPAIVAIDGAQPGLRPGMTANCRIVMKQLPEVLMIPVAAVIEASGKFNCWVVTEAGTERRPLLLGIRNDEMVEVKDGVQQGETVVENPRATVPEARTLHEQGTLLPPTEAMPAEAIPAEAPAETAS